MDDRRSPPPPPASHRFTTLEGWHSVGEGVFALGQRTLVYNFNAQFDLERDSNGGILTLPFHSKEQNSWTKSVLHTPVSSEGEILDGPQVEKPYHVFTPRQKWMVGALISAAGLFSGLSSNIYFPALDAIAQDLHVRPRDVNLTITSYLVIQGVAPLLWGALSDVLGRRPVYMASFAVYILANSVLSFSPSFAVLLLFRGLQAAGSASTVSLGNGVITDIAASSERGGLMSFYQAVRNVWEPSLEAL
ncbi:hypothetical protein N0V95_000538 [Ascochyta clinopodiicola]|nr:hypothetical protein N0V95_000538 [Ascochyta clinopodiicola]